MGNQKNFKVNGLFCFLLNWQLDILNLFKLAMVFAISGLCEVGPLHVHFTNVDVLKFKLINIKKIFSHFATFPDRKSIPLFCQFTNIGKAKRG